MSDEPNKRLVRCPKCGSADGYSYRIPCYVDYIGDWGEHASATAEATVGRYPSQCDPKTVVCLTCGARVPFGVAYGREDSR